jgi:hypothetical protein
MSIVSTTYCSEPARRMREGLANAFGIIATAAPSDGDRWAPVFDAPQ